MIGTAVLIAVACLVAGSFVMAKAWRLRTNIYHYDVTRDQRFDFPSSNSTPLDARLQNGTLEFTPLPSFASLVVLAVQVRSTLLGHWFEPSIEIAASSRPLRQPVERGGSGLRYVALSRLDLEGVTSLRLTGRHLQIPDQTVPVHFLQTKVDLDRQKILVIATHPDDAEIAAFGVYADRDAYVITLTAGEAGPPGPFERFVGAGVHYEKGRNRAWNSVTVPMLGGLSIARTANLGYFDGTLQEMRERPKTAVRSLNSGVASLDIFGHSENDSLMQSRQNRAATWDNLVADLEHLIDTIKPDILVAPYPLLDAHPDHKMSTVALVEAIKNLDWRHGSLLLYTNHLTTSDRYPFGNAGDLMALPPGVDHVFFEGIVSNPLDADKQARKHMALDAMIDLRPVIQVDSMVNVAKAFKSVLKTTITDGYISYFRQAVRANELFFEVRVASLYEPTVTDRIMGNVTSSSAAADIVTSTLANGAQLGAN